MGGTLTVVSEVGVGSRFALGLPRIEAEAGPISIDSPPVQS
jgi:signal transduction histidine kinase